MPYDTTYQTGWGVVRKTTARKLEKTTAMPMNMIVMIESNLLSQKIPFLLDLLQGSFFFRHACVVNLISAT